MIKYCRHCSAEVRNKFLDLGFAPPSNSYLQPTDLYKPELTYPLRLMICDKCFLVQTEDVVSPHEFFNSSYAYFSSTSKTFLEHAASYVNTTIDRFNLNEDSLVVEIASNDGYLLKYFLEKRIPCMGIEPASSTAKVAKRLGLYIIEEFFNEELADKLLSQNGHADLIIGNNVYAHVPDINNFTRGIAQLISTQGVVTLEFPHLMQMVENNQFDTAYHEHFSYLSLHVVKKIFSSAGLRIFDVEQISTHGGSLRVYGCKSSADHQVTKRVNSLLREEEELGMLTLQYYNSFQSNAEKIKNDLLSFLIHTKKQGKLVAGYGAAAKANTLLNYAGVKSDLLECIYDLAVSKQGKLMPGSHIKIVSPDNLLKQRPDYLLIFPWNILHEIREQLRVFSKQGMKFVTVMPKIKID